MKTNISKYLIFASLLAGFLFSGCKDDDKGHNSSAPVVVNRFYPTTGGVGTEVLIQGRNFSDNPADIKVTLGETELTVLGCDSKNILAVVPKKLGSGQLVVTVGSSKPVATVEEFTYSFSAIVTTLAGTGKPGYLDGEGKLAQFCFVDTDNPWRRGAVCVDDELNVYVGDVMNCCLRKITPDGNVTTLAGREGARASVDGTGLAARFADFYGMDCDSEGNIYITDVVNWTIRKVTPAGEVTTLGFGGFMPWTLAVDKRDNALVVGGTDDYNQAGQGVWRMTQDGTVTRISSTRTADVAVDKDGNIYAVEQQNNRIVKYAVGTWKESVVTGSVAGVEDGALATAKFNAPWGIATDMAGDLYIAGNGSWDGGIHPDQSIRRVDFNAGVVRTVAGSSVADYLDANGVSAAFHGPTALTVDKNGVIYVFDKQNHAVRKIVYE